MFFTLSGYLITDILFGFRGDVVASALYVSNWWYVGQHASYYARFAPPAPLDHLWSLAVEEQSVATGLVVAAVVTPGGLFGRALGCRPLRWLGVRSYAIYLWHYPVIVLTGPAGGAGTPVSLARAAAVVAVTVAIAAVSWRVVEDPIRCGPHRSRAATAAEGTGPRLMAGGGWRTRSRGSPVVIGGLCLLGVAVFTAGVASLAPRLDSRAADATAADAAAGS